MAVQALTDVLRARLHTEPDAVGYEQVEPSGRVEMLTYAQLAARASKLAERLTGCVDGPVLLAYPAGLDYVVAVFAGFLAGRPVIPAYPPGGAAAADRTRLAGIVADARPAVVVAQRRYPELLAPEVSSVPGPEADGAGWSPQSSNGRASGVAIVQYTSGSTGRPRGVLVSHDSLAANTAAIAERFRLTGASRGLTWLPPFHDMGLVGGLLTPMSAGIPVRILRPGDFLKSPLWWLRQISDSGATVSGGPNFAYELCLRWARTDDDLAGLDLSRWQVAFNGGESVKYRTLAEFAERFAAAGFRPEAFLPSYGLAEATLMVSAGPWSGSPGRAGSTVSCGVPVPGQRVAVVEPELRVPVSDGEEGEIWIGGPHITAGYLSGSPDDLFGELDGVRYLRTGDLGYLHGGELFVTGRAKDVIIFRGANFHVVDVEAAALDAVGEAAGPGAAFLVETDREPLAVLVLEMRGARERSVAGGVRAAVLARTRLPLAVVALVPPRSVPRTSSGKVRRSACRDAFLAGAFDEAMVSDPASVPTLADSRTRADASTELATMICGIVAGVCDTKESCQPTDRLVELGLDSVQAAEAAAVLEDALGLTVPLEALLTAPTPREAADTLMASWLAAGHASGLVRDRMAMASNGAGVV